MFAAALFMLAQAVTQELPDPKSPTAMGWLLAGIAALSVAGNQVLSGVINVRKLKGIDADTDGRYVSKAEHNALAVNVAETKGQVTALTQTLSNELRAIHRALGRVEGKLGTEPRNGD